MISWRVLRSYRIHMNEKPTDTPLQEQKRSGLEVPLEAPLASFERPVSEQEKEAIQEELLVLFDHVGEIESRHYGQSSFSYGEEDIAKLEQFDEKKRAEKKDASKRLWKKMQMALAPLLVLYATPSQDSYVTPESSNDSYSERTNASEQLKESGITDYQRQAYKGKLSDSLERNFTPWGYTGESVGVKTYLSDGLRVAVNMLPEVDTREQTTEVKLRSAYRFVDERKREWDEGRSIELANNRSDAWRMYLGIPQKYSTFGVSEFRPRESTEDRYYYKIQNFLRNTQMLIDDAEGMEDLKPIQFLLAVEQAQGSTEAPYSPLGYLAHSLRSTVEERFVAKDNISAIMGGFKLSKGHDAQGDYISYYDRWDLEGSVEGKEGVIGKPYEIYDRIYYDPQTFEVIQPENTVN